MGSTDILSNDNAIVRMESIKYFLAFPIYKIQECGIPGRGRIFEVNSKYLGFQPARTGIWMQGERKGWVLECGLVPQI